MDGVSLDHVSIVALDILRPRESEPSASVETTGYFKLIVADDESYVAEVDCFTGQASRD